MKSSTYENSFFYIERGRNILSSLKHMSLRAIFKNTWFLKLKFDQHKNYI